MAKFMVFAAIMIALLALVQASRFTITTTIDEDDNPFEQGRQSQRRCQQQIQQQHQQLRACQRYLASQSRRGPMDEMDMIIQQQGQQQQEQQQQHRQQCCQALQNFDDQCRCEAVREALRQQQQQQGPGQQGQQGQQQVRQAARFLPRQCNLGPRECQV